MILSIIKSIIVLDMDNVVFTCSHHAGKTYRDVRVNNTEWFIYLASEGTHADRINHKDFIEYCMRYIRFEGDKQGEVDTTALLKAEIAELKEKLARVAAFASAASEADSTCRVIR